MTANVITYRGRSAAREVGKTLSIDTEIRFRSAAERAAFSDELTRAVADLAARYHDEQAPGGRAHRVVVLAHPIPSPIGASPSPTPTES